MDSQGSLWQRVAGLIGLAPKVAHKRVPEDMQELAEIPGMPNVRAWGDTYCEYFQNDVIESIRQEIAAGEFDPKAPEKACIDILAVSGGGDFGGFGSGLMCGWTAAGDRPKFKLVTGISTGSLIAPLVLLGPDYDPQLREIYTQISTKDIANSRFILTAFWKDAVTDTAPLVELIKKYATDEAMAALAEEHRKGRRLFVGTTNLDAQRPVIWNMGAIAASGHPDAPDLFRKILLASTAIPVAFPPVRFEVEANGKRYHELHVDGGVSMQVFMYGGLVRPTRFYEELGHEERLRRARVFVIRNSYVDPQWAYVPDRLLPIAKRTIEALLVAQGIGDIYRVFAQTKRDELEFYLANIPAHVKVKSQETFDAGVASTLFDVGYEMAKNGYPWETRPPVFELDDEEEQRITNS
jgi:hypothetical protein